MAASLSEASTTPFIPTFAAPLNNAIKSGEANPADTSRCL